MVEAKWTVFPGLAPSFFDPGSSRTMSPSPHAFSKRFCALVLVLTSASALAQTDAVVFREFQFDFSTPGARANAMGRAFVGLADEATAAYSNPAGLSVLEKPEFSIEGRENQSFFKALRPDSTHTFPQSAPADSSFERDDIGFASLSFSYKGFNFSTFFVNNLDYRRAETQQTTTIETPEGYFVNYLNNHAVNRIRMNTQGLSVSRNFGRLSLGAAVSMAELDLDFSYNTKISVLGSYFIDNIVISTAEHKSQKPAYVVGALYQLSPQLKLGLSYKMQPKFQYSEHVVRRELQDDLPITFKIPDSVQFGVAIQPTDLWTILVDVDWTQYRQLIGENMSLFAQYYSFRLRSNYEFDRSEYHINQDPNYRIGTEYLLPWKKNILAFRFGGFFDPDHRTRFVGTPPPDDNVVRAAIVRVMYDTQSYLYNSGEGQDNIGATAGIGFVWHNKIQLDVAYVYSDRFHRAVTSLLYRF